MNIYYPHSSSITLSPFFLRSLSISRFLPPFVLGVGHMTLFSLIVPIRIRKLPPFFAYSLPAVPLRLSFYPLLQS